MRLSDIEAHNITTEEREIIYEWTDMLSDYCEAYPSGWLIEWDGIYGKHREFFDTEEEAEARLNAHNDRQLELLPKARKELAARKAAAIQANIRKGREKAAQRRLLKEARTIGGNCPELAELLVKMRNEYKTA